ncbi:MAG TPA: hypothetical protein VMZ52_18845, partial [Bryobacteraceae bacterium]|nr:hypothetical protein [Bryobacteraceae bacterium]
MRSLPAYLALFGLGYIPAPAADWLNDRGDPQRSGWQQRERGLSAASASQMKLLWKRKLEGPAGISNVLTAPVMLGPLVTHRGIKELVFVAGASNMVYAVDADLGTLFWQRSLKIVVSPPDNSKSGCGAGLTTAPAISPAGGPPRPADQDEGFTPLRPLYVVSSDGTLHSIRPSDGADMAPARKFVPAGTNVSSLNVAGGFV